MSESSVIKEQDGDQSGGNANGKISEKPQEGKDNNFDLLEELKKKRGTVIEIGGPTPDGYRLSPNVVVDMVDVEDGARVMYIIDRRLGKQIVDESTGEIGHMGVHDFIADGTQLPIDSKTLSGVFVSCLPLTGNLRERVIIEANRVLKNDGILVLQGGTKEDLDFAKCLGLKLKKYY